MSEQSNNSPQEGQKTVIAFVAGLLVGGLLVWVFGGTSDEQMSDDTDNQASVIDSINGNDNDSVDTGTVVDNSSDTSSDNSVSTGAGSISVDNQSAGSVVALDDVTFPNDEGWIGVRDYNNGQLTGLLGVARWSLEQGLVPSSITLLRPTEAGSEYAAVFYSENGDREFSLADDVQLDTTVAVFEAE